jgi:hypothetical protein
VVAENYLPAVSNSAMIAYFEDEADAEVFLRICKLIAFMMEENERLKP